MGTITLSKLNLCSLMLLITIVSTVLISQKSGGNTLNFAITTVFVMIVIVITMIEKKPFRLFPPYVILAIWLCFALISSMMATDVDVALKRAIQIIQILVLVSVATNVIVWSGRSGIFFLVYMSAAVLSYIGSLLGIGFGAIDATLVAEGTIADRAVGLTSDANRFGILMVWAQMTAVFLGVQARERYVKYLALSAFLLLGIAVIHSGSRTALVGTIILVAGCSWIFRVWRIENAAKFLAMLALASIIASAAYISLKDTDLVRNKVESFLSNESIAARYENLLAIITSSGDVNEADNSVESSITQRLQYAKTAWDAAVSAAPFGLGLNNFKVKYGGYAHSNYMEILATTGFLGLFIFMGIYVCMYMSAFRMRGKHHDNPFLIRVFMVSVATFMIMEIGTVTYYFKPFWLFVAIAIGSIEVARDAQSRKGT